ncbi:MAG: alpha-L-glutamate ligase-like protein [Thermodesulfobacteriota bacterium]
MILKPFRWLRDVGVLGMNRRNAEYILRFNPRSSFPLVDDKLKTKQLAEAYQIPTPPLYRVIKHHGEMARFEEMLGDYQDFVVKPARGTGGSGIVLVTGRTEGGFINQSGEVIPMKDLAYHISDILSGIYSLEGLEDRAFLEALVHPDTAFDAVTYRGVPDIRIIVYRGVPVMSMVRLPTRVSDGKANLHRGAVGVGINMGNGTTLSGVYRSAVVTHHPDTKEPVAGIQVRHWESILLIAARAVDMINLDFLGVDLVIDRDRGPLLLELNARPGLQIQVANQTGLLKRLESVDKAPREIFATPEIRVAWVLETFATPVSN